MSKLGKSVIFFFFKKFKRLSKSVKIATYLRRQFFIFCFWNALYPGAAAPTNARPIEREDRGDVEEALQPGRKGRQVRASLIFFEPWKVNQSYQKASSRAVIGLLKVSSAAYGLAVLRGGHTGCWAQKLENLNLASWEIVENIELGNYFSAIWASRLSNYLFRRTRNGWGRCTTNPGRLAHCQRYASKTLW